MESVNPYQSPSADVAMPAQGYDVTSPFSPKGRFGRLSYLAWVFLAYVPIWILSVFASPSASHEPGQPPAMDPANMIVGIVVLIYLIPMLVAMWLFAIRRLHDFNASGWWSLLYLVPVVNFFFGLVLMLRSGTQGGNDFGPERITRGWEKVLGIIGIVMMVIALIGIVAAIAIPYYVSAH